MQACAVLGAKELTSTCAADNTVVYQALALHTASSAAELVHFTNRIHPLAYTTFHSNQIKPKQSALASG
jgi:hypothetical protein